MRISISSNWVELSGSSFMRLRHLALWSQPKKFQWLDCVKICLGLNPFTNTSSGASSFNMCAHFESSSMRVRNRSYLSGWVTPLFWRLWCQSLAACNINGTALPTLQEHDERSVHGHGIEHIFLSQTKACQHHRQVSRRVRGARGLVGAMPSMLPVKRSNNVYPWPFAKVLPTDFHQICKALIVCVHALGHGGRSMSDPSKCFGPMCAQWEIE